LTANSGQLPAASSLTNPAQPSLTEGARSANETPAAPAAFCCLRYCVTSYVYHAPAVPETVSVSTAVAPAVGLVSQVSPVSAHVALATGYSPTAMPAALVSRMLPNSRTWADVI
jgi:hypothetical protein